MVVGCELWVGHRAPNLWQTSCQLRHWSDTSWAKSVRDAARCHALAWMRRTSACGWRENSFSQDVLRTRTALSHRRNDRKLTLAIAATNRDLTAAVADGTFRLDLFYRLKVFPLETPPLREQRGDIPKLVEHFIGRYGRKAGKTFRRLSKRTLDCLQSYPWPGNVRQLQNVIEWSVIVSDTDEFTVDESWLSPRARRLGAGIGLSSSLAANEKAIVEDALRASRGRVFGLSGAAARLGIPRSTLESKIRALKIDKRRFRTLAKIS
jgi:DNA-binding NtrC family response regulator